MIATPPFVLTLKLDQRSFDQLNALRQRHFPRARNLVPAHITLFHALPGDQAAAIEHTLEECCAQTPIFAVDFPSVRSLGKGVALDVHSPQLIAVRQRLAETWSVWLSAQDQQRYRPHLTIQNKVTPEAARELYEQIASTWQPIHARGEGLLLWRYLGGPWELARSFAFAPTS